MGAWPQRQFGIVSPELPEFYYVPALKNYVKSIEEQYDTDNVRVSRETRVLVSFKPAA
jgi:hypothetical protein